jgi:hypothetical protein
MKKRKLRQKLSVVADKMEILSYALLISVAIYTHSIYYGYHKAKNEKKREPWL